MRETATFDWENDAVLLSYTPKTWNDANGDTLTGYVATITTYNLDGQSTDTYSATYLQGTGDSLNFTNGTLTGTTGTVTITNAIYNDATQSSGGTLLHTSHTDYTGSGQVSDSSDQYGDETTYTYDLDGQSTSSSTGTYVDLINGAADGRSNSLNFTINSVSGTTGSITISNPIHQTPP